MTEAAKMVGGVDDALVDPTSTATMPTSAEVRARDAQLPLRRGVFPRPFAITSLPIRDISMQSVEGEPGDFKLYQVRRRRRGKDDRRMVGGSRLWRRMVLAGSCRRIARQGEIRSVTARPDGRADRTRTPPPRASTSRSLVTALVLHLQGVWRFQCLSSCAPPGQDAMRLT